MLGTDRLTSTICSNVVTLLANERDPDEFAMASATAVFRCSHCTTDALIYPAQQEGHSDPDRALVPNMSTLVTT